jgi:hypothetical protein
MGILSKIFGASTAAVTEPINAVGSIVKTIFGDKGEKLTHEEVMARIQQNPMMVQAEINKVEAGHRSTFVAGWRPFIGWVCGIGLAQAFLIAPWMDTFGRIAPSIPLDRLMELVIAMLGLAAYRTVEKLAGRAK